MNLDELIIAWFCLIDDLVPLAIGNEDLRQSGPEPTLADSEVITMEVIGMYLGLNHPRDAQRDAPSAQCASPARSPLALFGQGIGKISACWKQEQEGCLLANLL